MMPTNSVTNYGRLTHLRVRTSFPAVENSQPRFLTSEQIEQWNDQGYILNLPILNAAELEAARAFFSQMAADPATKAHQFNAHARQRFVADLVRHRQTLGYLQDLIGSDIVCFISEYINKAPGAPMGNHGHQDCVFNAMDVGSPIVWLALDDADEGNGCMQFVPQSHRLGIQECGSDFALHDASRFDNWVPARVRAGHGVLMSDLLIHSSPANPSATRDRPAFTATYADARTPLWEEFTAEPILCCGGTVHPSWKIRSEF